MNGRLTHNIDFEGTSEVDAHWLSEWAAYGIAELESYLRKQARFDAFISAEATMLVRGA